jgi:hypothetical protein
MVEYPMDANVSSGISSESVTTGASLYLPPSGPPRQSISKNSREQLIEEVCSKFGGEKKGV